MFIVNALANSLPINGLNTGEVSALYPNFFTPAGITFSIWIVIYSLLAGFVVWGWVRKHQAGFTRLSLWFIASCVLNMCWIVVWHYLYVGTSVLIMLGLLVVLSKIFFILQERKPTDGWERTFVYLPFTIYFAWICVATIANVSAWLVAVQWDGVFFSEKVWAAVMMGVATLLALVITLRYRAPAFTLVVLWALFGIYWRWRLSEEWFLVMAALAGVAVLSVVLIIAVRRRLST